MANGCVVVTEPSEGCQPLVAGEHFVEATLDAHGRAPSTTLLDDEAATRPHRRHTLARSIFGELALVNSLSPLLDRIEG